MNTSSTTHKRKHPQAKISEIFFLDALNPLTVNVPQHKETSQLICNANRLTGFYMIGEHWSLMS